MNNNKIKAILMSALILSGTMLDGTLAMAENNTVDIPTNGGIEQQINEKSTPVINGIKVNKRLIDINYSKGVTIVPKYIVIHDTDNRAAGADAMANRNYFANHPNVNASAHYIIDDSNIVQALEDTWKGWHVGDGGASANIHNGNSIGIELAVNSGNNFDKTTQTGVALTRYLMNKYGIPAQNVVMHNHASGKICSRMMIQDRPNMWEEFKYAAAKGMQGESLINDGIKPTAKGKIVNVSSYLNVRTAPNAYASTLGNVYPNKIMNIYGEENGYYKVDFMGTRKTYGYVSKDYIKLTNGDIGTPDTGIPEDVTQINKDGIVINVNQGSSLNMRSGAGTNHGVVTTVPANAKVKVNHKTNNGWYNITYGGKTGFVSGDYIKIVETSGGSGGNTGGGTTDNNIQINKDGVVINVSTTLNMRSGAGTNHGVVTTVPANAKVKVNHKTSNGWYNITYGGKTGFVSGDYIKIVETSGGSGESGGNTGGGTTDNNTQINKDGVVINVSTTLNMRSGAGTNHGVVTTVPANAKVKVNHKTSNGWYNITYGGKTGFVSGDYIKIVETSGGSGESGESGGNTGGGTTDNNTQINKDGVVINVSTTLNMRSGAGTNHGVVTTVPANAKVKVNHKTSNGWYNITYGGKTGFVSGDYIKIVETSGGSGESGGNTGGGTTDNNTQINKDGVVINVNQGSSLNMRSGSGTNHSIVTRIPANAKVKVNYKTSNGWYNINYNGQTGFVSSDYIRLEQGTSNEGIGQKAKVINVSTSLNVRSGRGTNYSVVGYLNKDEVVTVLDHKDGWHKIEYVANGNKKTGYVKDSFIKIL